MSKPVLVQQFGDVANDQTGRGDDFGMYDNGVWQNILDIAMTPNAGPNNKEGLRTEEQHATWLRDHKVDVALWTLWLLGPSMARIKMMTPGFKAIGLIDHPLTPDLSVSEPTRVVRFLNSLEAYDAVCCLTPREANYYGGIHPNVHLVGLPFPHKAYERHRVETNKAPLGEKKEITVGLSVGGPGWSWFDRNYVTTTYAFRALVDVAKQNGYTVKGVWLSVGYAPDSKVYQFLEAIPDTTMQVRSGMENYYKALQMCDFCISHIWRDTPGRLVAEAAYFGVPVIGSHTLSLQPELFPSLSVDPYDIATTVNKSMELISDGYPESMLKNAQIALHDGYGYEASRRKFRQVWSSLGFNPDEGWSTI